MTLETDIGCLKRLPLFDSLPAPRLKLVALMGEKLSFAADTQIIAAGEEPDSVYIVMEGEVVIGHGGSEGNGKRFLMATGSIIGDVPMLCGQHYVGEVTAKTDVIALRLPRDLFFELLETIPDFGLALSRDLASRLYRLAAFVLNEEEAPT